MVQCHQLWEIVDELLRIRRALDVWAQAAREQSRHPEDWFDRLRENLVDQAAEVERQAIALEMWLGANERRVTLEPWLGPGFFGRTTATNPPPPPPPLQILNPPDPNASSSNSSPPQNALLEEEVHDV